MYVCVGLMMRKLVIPFPPSIIKMIDLLTFPKFFLCVFVSVAKVITGSEGIFFVLINLVIFSLDLQINVSKIDFDVKIHLCIVPISNFLKDCIHYSMNTLHLTVALLLSRPGKSNLLLDIRDTFCRCQVIWEKDEFFLQQKKLLLRNRVNII